MVAMSAELEAAFAAGLDAMIGARFEALEDVGAVGVCLLGDGQNFYVMAASKAWIRACDEESRYWPPEWPHECRPEFDAAEDLVFEVFEQTPEDELERHAQAVYAALAKALTEFKGRFVEGEAPLLLPVFVGGEYEALAGPVIEALNGAGVRHAVLEE